MHIPRAHLLSRENFNEAQAQRVIDWSLSKNTSLSPHLITPEIFSLSADEEPSSHSEVERHPRRDEWVLGEIRERDSVNEAETIIFITLFECIGIKTFIWNADEVNMTIIMPTQ